jgi:phage terminase large subunit-like protein
VKPNKQKSREKIDGIVAGVMALDRATRNVGPQDLSAAILADDWGM